MLIMLIELGILVLPQSRTKAVDVGINYANQTTTGQREQFFKARYFSWPGFPQSSLLLVTTFSF